MPPKTAPAPKRQQLTFAQLAAYDDILTDALIDHAYYWTTIPKNRPSYHPSRGIREEEITKLIQTHLIVDPNMALAEEKLLATDGLRKFCNSLKTAKEKDDFKAHLRRYMSIYLPDCPFEVNATNRYTIVTYEASITARRFIRRNETIKYLAGIQVTVTREEEAQLALRKKDFSLVVSSRSKLTSLFMGPARFANHDCDPNARLVTRGQAGIEIIACRDIEVGEEITVTYSESYFGVDNCECLCQTCEKNLTNGWKPRDGEVAVQRSIEEDPLAQGYSLRRRRRDQTESGAGSRASSVTPDIRPRVLKRQRSLKMAGERCSTMDLPEPERLGVIDNAHKRSREGAGLDTPPVTPAKRLKTMQYDIFSIPMGSAISRDSSETTASQSSIFSEDGNGSSTQATSPESEKPALHILSPDPSPIKKTAEVGGEVDKQQLPEPISPACDGQNDQITILLATEVIQPEATPADIDGSPESSLADNRAVSDTPTPVSVTPEPRQSLHPNETTPSTTETTGSGDQNTSTDTADSQTADAPMPAPTTATNSKRGRPASQAEAPISDSLVPNTTNTRPRTPGDYTLTPLLLSVPESAWIHCTNCSSAFVQHDAYFTRSSCWRCERHSKLYGYVWPKTCPAGKGDKEERVLDHRTVHRFLGPDEEMRVRGRKGWRERSAALLRSEEGGERESGSVNLGLRGGELKGESAVIEGLRRSGRRRRASARALGED
ncbi:hypothetical protein VTI74DRAFT_11232 [Chaetomium olivicolor]